MPEFDIDAALKNLNGAGEPVLSTCCDLNQQVLSWTAFSSPAPSLTIAAQCPCGRVDQFQYLHTGFTQDDVPVEGRWARQGAECPVCGDETGPWDCSWSDNLHEKLWFITREHSCWTGDTRGLRRVKEIYSLSKPYA